mmetsp:Transcript_18796/g.64704  ORF Transcript_18796/g.64704 Transcript_18796/m.64704 type:complete len:108 (+) Transcript_18796:1827-2150(+)
MRRWLRAGGGGVEAAAPEACVVCASAVAPACETDAAVLRSTCSKGHVLLRCAKTLRLFEPDHDRWACPACGHSWIDTTRADGAPPGAASPKAAPSLCPLCHVHGSLS